MRGPIFPCVALVALVLSACGPKNVHGIHHGQALATGTLGVTTPVVVHDLPGAVTREAFYDNLVVGHLQMSGGYVTVEDLGMQTRSRTVTIQGQDAYREQATVWLGEALTEELQRRNVNWTPVTLAPETVPAPTRARHRGSHPEDDHDNLSLPRWTFQPEPLEPSALTHLDPTVSAVLVPMLLHYYSHNGGWFLGQTMGCAGGARIRVGWAVYDRATGQPLQWGDVDARELSDAEFSPNSAVLQDFLLAAEQRLQKELRRHLVR